jgi:hypothetical protein
MASKRSLTHEGTRALLQMDIDGDEHELEGPSGKESGPELRVMMSLDGVYQVLRKKCCVFKCVKQFEADEVLELRQPLFSKNRTERHIWHATCAAVSAYAAAAGARGGRPTRRTLIIFGDSKKRFLCTTAYRALMAIGSNENWASVLEAARSGNPAMHEVSSSSQRCLI